MCVPCAFTFISGPTFLKLLIPVNNYLGSRAKPAEAVGIFGAALAQVLAGSKNRPLRDGLNTSWGLVFDRIGETGFEPAASCSQSKRATKLRHSPNTEIIVLNGLPALARVLGSGHTRAIRAK